VLQVGSHNEVPLQSGLFISGIENSITSVRVALQS